ncbi:TlyA family RNA methyltransferase [Gudongella sp. DL1XJH-153]|uniref:TlyA family RNA methyltransferase n=1 Tax=Gudongella sp. DL1XJH-153 TaxID=3409804 RepID=UPI003BB7E9C3
MEKKRADVILFEKGLVESREKGKRIIMEGSVYIGETRVDKPGEKYSDDVEIKIRSNPLKYVSRGGLKLEKAMDEFGLQLRDFVCMDMGSSTGGFTDCMLKSGASKVYAVDVGYGQLDWKLRSDERVVVHERTNIRHMDTESIPDKIDFISIDVSFISLKLILPVAHKLLKDGGSVVALVKPQFEAGRDKVGKKGIVREKSTHKEVIENVLDFSGKIGFYPHGLTFSPITGTTGNIEFLLLLKKEETHIDENTIDQVIYKAHENLK